MANSILDTIMGQLDGDTLSQLGQHAGVDDAQAKQGLSAAVPLLLAALERNARSPEGAEALQGALQRDHDGSILDDLPGFLGNPAQGNGTGILEHVLGDKRPGVEQNLGKMTNLGGDSMRKLLELAAPLVMAALGRQQRAGGIGVNDLGSYIGKQREASESGANIMGMITNLLDADKDGSVLDDLTGLAGKMFGSKG